MILDVIFILAILCIGVCCISQYRYIQMLENQIVFMKDAIRSRCGFCNELDDILEVVD